MADLRYETLGEVNERLHANADYGKSAYPVTAKTYKIISGYWLLAGAATLLAAMLHLWMVPEHMMDYVGGDVPGWLPLGFAATAVLGFVYAFALPYVAGTRRFIKAGIVLNAVMLAAGAWSRLAGLPGAHREPILGSWVTAMTAEAIALGVLLVLLVKFGQRAQLADMPRLPMLLAVTVAVALLAFTLVGPTAFDHARMLAWNGWMIGPDRWMW
jgi:hypothetical protein